LKRANWFYLLCALIFAVHLSAEVVDRIAASVDNQVITKSDIELQIRVAAFQSGEKPDLSPAHRHDVLESMIDQKLIQRDLENSRYPLPDPGELSPAIEQFKSEHYPEAGAYEKALASYGISDADFRGLLLWERTLSSFIDVRFTSTAQVTDQQIAEYFESTVKPAAELAHPGQPVRVEDYHDQIEKKLSADRANAQMETWLKGARRRAQIVVHEEALQ
jgi:parvulin-like peptidyl-prolyl isomerase